MIIQNGTVFTRGASFQKTTIEIREDKIQNLTTSANAGDSATDCYDAADCYVIPGLVDLHFHGCVGADISDHKKEGIRDMAAYELRNGITAICPATMTLPEAEIAGVLTTASDYMASAKGAAPGADLVGINLEGPFISPAKKGAQNEDYIKNPDLEMFARLQALAPGLARLITVAPELPGAMDFISAVKDQIIVSLGHSTANYATASEAFSKGARHVTHLLDAMSPFGHRDTGIVGAAFDNPAVRVELISDGIHISDSMIRAVFQLFTEERVILISDSMRAAGMPDGSYTLGGQAVTVNGRLATLADGTIAGSVTNLMDCMRYAIRHAGIPLEKAVKAATMNPARELGIEKLHGQITEGALANLVILDKDLHIKDIIFHGRILSPIAKY